MGKIKCYTTCLKVEAFHSLLTWPMFSRTGKRTELSQGSWVHMYVACWSPSPPFTQRFEHYFASWCALFNSDVFFILLAPPPAPFEFLARPPTSKGAARAQGPHSRGDLPRGGGHGQAQGGLGVNRGDDATERRRRQQRRRQVAHAYGRTA